MCRLCQNVIQARSFAGMLEAAIRRYQNRTIEAAQVIGELIELAKEIRRIWSGVTMDVHRAPFGEVHRVRWGGVCGASGTVVLVKHGP